MAKPIVAHFDIPGEDLKATSQFYADTFGWKITAWPEYNYYTFAADGDNQQGGGFNSTADPAKWHPGEVIVYLQTASIEDDLAKVTANGGSVIVPRSEVPGGAWALFADPQGVRIGLWEDAPAES